MPEFKTESTPNPNSLKITANGVRFLDAGLVSASSVEEADPETLAHDLLSIDQISDVLILPAFLTISRTEGADWDDLLPRVQDVLADHFHDT